jgi:ABC-2 type transport system permease protein
MSGPWALEARYELLKAVRMPVFTLMVLVFPVVFYLLFGVALSRGRAMGGRDMALVALGAYGAFGVIGVALFSFGVGVATERAQGWLLLKRVTPMRPLTYVTGKVAATMVLCGVIVAGLALSAAFAGGVRLPAWRWVMLVSSLVCGSIPFCAIGLAVGFSAGPNSAPAVVNVVHLVGAFIGGLWMPLDLLPRALQNLAPFVPQYHLGRLAMTAIGQGTGPHVAWHLFNLGIWAAIGIAAAVHAFRTDDGRVYG